MQASRSQDDIDRELAMKLQEEENQRVRGMNADEHAPLAPPPYPTAMDIGSASQTSHVAASTETWYPKLDTLEGYKSVAPVSQPTIQNLQSASHPASAWKAGLIKWSPPGAIIAHTYFFWFNDEPVSADYLRGFIRKSKVADTSQTVYRATRSGKGLLFYGKAGVDINAADYIPSGVVNLSWADESEWEEAKKSHSEKQFGVAIAGKTYSFHVNTKYERESWVGAFTDAIQRGKRWEMETEMTTKGPSNLPSKWMQPAYLYNSPSSGRRAAHMAAHHHHLGGF